jgi:ribosomal protein S18 acetylase RimI-like enzyme
MEKPEYRKVIDSDIETICKFPQDENELFFMFPKSVFPLNYEQLKSAIDVRSDSIVIVSHITIVGFANFYETIKDQYCSIGNVIVNPLFRSMGAGAYLIKTMEDIAINKYKVKELHISCFNQNITGLLLYSKLGYKPYEIEKRFDKKSKPVALIKMKKELNL